MADVDILSDFADFKKSNFGNAETNPELAARLKEASRVYREKFNKELPVTGKTRTREEQQDLYNRFRRGEKGIYMPIDPSKEPDREIFHTDAVDISRDVPEAFLNQFGIHRPLGKKDPVHAVINPSYKGTFYEPPQDDILKQFEQDKLLLNQPEEEKTYQPGFYNPNLVAQGEQARRAGGGNLQPIVEGVTNALKSMSLEDWKKESTLANMLKYGVGEMPIVGDQGFHQEGRNKLIESGKAAINALLNPSQTYEAISQAEPGDLLGQIIKNGIYDLPLGPSAKPVMTAASAVAKPVISVAGKVLTPAAEGFGTLQESFANAKKAINPTVSIEPLELSKPMIGGGAALTANGEAVKNALYQAKPELIADLIKQTGVKSFDELPFDELPLEVIDRHNKFAKFDMTPTEGEALQDIKKMSIETNERTKDDLIRQRLEERDPKLIAGFNKIRETVAPDVYEANPAKLANTALEKMKQNFIARNANEEFLYKKLADANGGNLPFNISDLKNTIDSQLKKEKSYRATIENPIYKELEDQMALGTMTYDDMIHFRTRLAAGMRSSKDGNITHGLGIIYDKLHEMPLPENLAYLRPLDDAARNAFKEHKQLQKDLPAYKAAINDIRTEAEINAGNLHPASNTFLDKFYGPQTPQVEINRLLNEIGHNGVEHQSLNAATIDKIKRASGVKGELGNETGKISQAQLSDQLNKIYANNLPTMFKQEHLIDLKDLADVANMTEHVKGGHSVNTSNSALETERLQKKQLAENLALDLAEGAVNAKTGILGTVARKVYEIKKGKSAKEAAELEAQLNAEKRVSPSAGIQLKNIGKE